MSKADSNCHKCGTKGHFASECMNEGIDASGKPPWCGICDEMTRLLDGSIPVVRCQVCHPLARQQLKQFRKCPRCHVTVYEYDHAPCGQHAGPEIPERRPDRKRIEQIVNAA